MGLFFNYNKPGPGVDKNAPKKKGIFRYFEIFSRKLGKLIQLNMLYFICSLPMIAIIYLLCTPFIMNLFLPFSENGALSQENIVIFQAMLSLLVTFSGIIILGSGPASAAASYIYRNFIREEHVWLISDFFAKFKENFKQGMIISVVDLIMTGAGFVAIGFYYNQFITKGSTLWFALMCLLIIFICLFLFMHCYIYQLMITFENKIIDLYKNAMLLTLSTLPMLLLISVPVFVIIYFIFTTFTPIASLLISFIAAITYLRFPYEFYAASIIKSRILDTLPNQNESEENNYREDY